jgi:Zinc finger, C2H2 type
MKLFNLFLFLVIAHGIQAMEQPTNIFDYKEIYDDLPALTDITLPTTPTMASSLAETALHANATHLKRKSFQDESEYLPAAAFHAQRALESETIGYGFPDATSFLEKEGSVKLPEKPVKEASAASHASNTFKCQFCSYSTYNKANLTRHQNLSHKTEMYKELNDPNFKKEVVCPRHPECPQTFMNVQEYYDHIRMYNHTALPAAAVLGNIAKTRLLEPNLIPAESKSFTAKPGVSVPSKKPQDSARSNTFTFNHNGGFLVETSSREKLECPVVECEYYTTIYAHLKNHILCKHTKILPYVCPGPKCTKKFNTSSNLHRHAQKVHQGMLIPLLSQEAKDSIKKELAPFLKASSQKKQLSSTLSKKESK